MRDFILWGFLFLAQTSSQTIVLKCFSGWFRVYRYINVKARLPDIGHAAVLYSSSYSQIFKLNNREFAISPYPLVLLAFVEMLQAPTEQYFQRKIRYLTIFTSG